MTNAAVTLVVHGARWPDASRPAALRDRVARLAQAPVDVVMARDEAAHPRGAAACIRDAVARAEADRWLIVDAAAPCTDADLRRVLEALDAARGDERAALACLVPPDEAARELAIPPTGELLLTHLRDAVRAPTPPGRDDPSVWAVRRDAWDAVGGLDAEHWSIGAVDDLAARLTAAGFPVARLAADAATTVAACYPLAADVRTFLAWRNPLRTAVRTLPSDRLGPALARDLAALLAAAWQATGIDAATVRFGGDWGRASIGARMLTRLGWRASRDLWPADEAGTVLPLLALLACARDLPTLVGERARWVTASAAEGAGERASEGESGGDGEGEGERTARRAVPTLPTVSVIVVTWNGRAHLHDCFTSLAASDYPADRLELLCVDNGSTDGTVEWMAQHFPAVRTVVLPENRGFTGGNAAGVAEATGDVLLFLNNDMRVEPTLVRRMVDALGPDTTCVAARVMSWDGKRIDFVRGTASFEVRGFQEHYQQTYTAGMRLADSFFPNGGAFAVTRQAYDEAGGFDPALFAYYDDVDLGWRLRAMGHAVRTVPEAIAYHRHGATVRTQPSAHKRFLMDRNALRVALRAYDDASLPRVLPALLLLAGLRVAQDLRLTRSATARRLRHWLADHRRPPASADVYVSPAGGRPTPLRLLRSWPAPPLAAIGHVLSRLDEIAAARGDFQPRRRVADAQLLPHLGRPFESLDGRTSYRRTQRALVALLDLEKVIGARPHVVIVTHEALKRLMSGPAVRVLEMGRVLSRSARVSIASPGPIEVDDPRVATVAYDPAAPEALRLLAESADLLVVQGFALHSYPFLTRLVAPLVVDLYCPFTLEHLEQTRHAGVPSADVVREARAILDVQNAQLGYGDVFLCASERQRDFWIGALHTAGRVNPATLADDPDLTDLVRVVPFGLPDEPFEEAAARVAERRRAAGRPAGVLKGVHPAIPASAKVLLWGGSLLDWQDPETLIDAVARLSARRDDVRLFFLGVKHPNPQVKPMAIVERARERARQHGLLDTHVVFNDWVPYEERAAYLAEADLGVSTHRLHLETRYSFRTRMLDYLWARLPIVCTDGDYFGELVRTEGLGRAVPPGDADALAEAIATLLDDADARAAATGALTRVSARMTWSAVVEPLRAFCAAPRFAADRAGQVARFHDAMSRSFAGTHAAKKALLAAGLSEGTLETIKRWPAVQQAMTLRNRVAVWRARRRAVRA